MDAKFLVGIKICQGLVAGIINHFPEVPGSAVTYEFTEVQWWEKVKRPKKKKKSAFLKCYPRPDDIKLNIYAVSQGEREAHMQI